ncbi:hypothetical protein NC652_025803 [Populus alba x Populus x berolinensis]|nr:hypothetical protein NC652_025803 [Populus alba x Populus x berolinensis]
MGPWRMHITDKSNPGCSSVSTTTPFGIVIGIWFVKCVQVRAAQPLLIVVGLLNGIILLRLLNYMALVDLLAADFMGPKLQDSMRLQAWSFIAVHTRRREACR